MAGLLKNAVVILVLITVAKPSIAADEAPTTSALQEASPESEGTTRRDDQFEGRYPVELCNPFYEFWENHHLVWTVKSSDSLSDKCQQQERKGINTTGVMLKNTRITRLNESVPEEVFWKFRNNGSMARDHSTAGYEVIYLVYNNDSAKCGVVKHEGWYYWKDASEYRKSCDETWCTCILGGPGKTPYSCLNNPFFEVIRFDEPKNEVPQDCAHEYDSRRIEFRQEDNNVTAKMNCNI